MENEERQKEADSSPGESASAVKCIGMKLHFSDYSQFRCIDKTDEILYLRPIRHLFFHLQHRVEDAGLTMKNQSIGIGNVLNALLVYAIGTQHHGVDPSIGERFAAKNDVGRHIFRESGTGLNHGAVAHTGFCVLDNAGRENHTIAYLAVAGYLRAVAKDTIVAHFGVVRNVCAFHQEIVVADNGLASGMGGSVDDYVFADGIAIADHQFGRFARKVEVLWQCTQHRALKHLVVIAQACAVENTHKGIDGAVISNDNIVFDVSEGIYFAVLTDSRFGRNLGSCTYIVCHNLSFLSPESGGLGFVKLFFCFA